MKKYILLAFATVALAATSCDLDTYPYNAVSSDSMRNAENAETATVGNYGLFKSHFKYRGMDNVGWTYIRHYQQLSELKSDNVLMSGRSTDPLFLDATLEDTPGDNNTASWWYLAYKICYSTSAVINVIDEADASPLLLQLKGENLFLRAVAHLHLSQIFSKPYSFGRDNMGVVLRTESAGATIERASVGAVYDQIEDDLKNAIRLMDGKTRRGNNGFASKEAAQGLLSRLYLWEGRDQECIDLVTEMLAGADPVSKLDPSITNLYQRSKESPEVLWCIALTSISDPNDFAGAQAMAGSMFYSLGDPGNGTGWAEIYYSQNLLDLFFRYPEDKRLEMLKQHGKSTTGKKMIYWPTESTNGDVCRLNYIDRAPTYDPITEKYTCVDASGVSHVVETELVNTYPRTYIMLGGQKQYVSVADSMGCRTGAGSGDSLPCNYMMKFSNQDGVPSNLASPIYVRWAEVILNRAEAYAHLGQDQKALDDVNAIRTRAGLTGDAQMTLTNMTARGYATALDVVLDERRLELCFEGFRVQDIQRNKKSLDRRYAGRQPYEVVNWDDPRLLYYIPETEIDASGIPQNR